MRHVPRAGNLLQLLRHVFRLQNRLKRATLTPKSCRTGFIVEEQHCLGQLVIQIVLILALLVFHSGGSSSYREVATQYTFRVSFAFIAIFLLFLIYIRVFKLTNAGTYLSVSPSQPGVLLPSPRACSVYVGLHAVH